MDKTKQSAAEVFNHLANLKEIYKINPSCVLENTIQNITTLANILMKEEMAAKEQKFYDKNNEADWWRLARKQYPITTASNGYFVVTSNICNRPTPMFWVFEYKFDALQKIEQLVKWVNAKREIGVGDKFADVKKFKANQFK